MLKKILILVFIIIFTISGCYAATKTKSPYKTKIIEVHTKDSHIIKAKLIYKKTKQKGVKYPLVICLHSLGYSSSHWGNLPNELLKQNYAVLLIDLRGHGTSNQDIKFNTSSWTYYSNKTFQKYPSDVIAVLDQTKQTVKKVNYNNYSIIGGDIGANTAVLVAQKMHTKPKSLVLLSPCVETKGLILASLDKPSAIAEVGNGPILVMCSKQDKQSVNQELLLKKFVHTKYIINNVNVSKNGMMLIKNNSEARKTIINFLKMTLK